MIVLVIILGLIGVVALGAAVIGLISKNAEATIVGGIATVLVLVFLFFMSLTNVDAKNVGIVRFGGNVNETTLDGGWHLKKPWESVNEVDGTEQFEKYHGQSAIEVALGDRSATTMSVTVRWQINTERANEIYQRYRGDDPVSTFRDRVVSPQIISAAVAAAQGYNPLSQLKSIDPQKLDKGFEFKVDYVALGAEIKEQVTKETLGLAEIISVTVTKLPLSDTSQKRVNTFIASISDTLIAQQGVKTAEQIARANEIIAASLKANPEVNEANCIKAVAEAAPGVFPAGFTCGDSGGAVVIPSK